MITHPIEQTTYGLYEVFGPTVEFLSPPSPAGAVYCVMRGTIPAGVSVPLHSHPDPETFFVWSGTIQVLCEEEDRLAWREARPGDVVHVPSGSKHAFRNATREPVVEIVTTTPNLAKFFQEVGRPVTSQRRLPPPTRKELEAFIQTSKRYGQWLATPEENAAVGLKLFE